MKKATVSVMLVLWIACATSVQALALAPVQQTHTVTLTSDHEASVGYNALLDQKVAYDSTQDRLRFGNYVAPPPSSGDAYFRSYLHFDLGGLPADAVIQQATFSLLVYDQRFPGGPALDAGVHRVTSGWTEAGLSNTANWTWASLPPLAATPEAVNTVLAMDVWYNWDVTSLTRSWHNGSAPNFGLAVSESPMGSAAQGCGAYSRAGGVPQFAPRLVVTYVGAAPAPATPLPVEIRPVIQKWATPQEALPGEEVTYTIQATNQGRDAPIDVVITDIVSEHMEVIEATTSQGTVEVAGQTVTANVGVIGQNFVVEVVIRVRVREDAPAPLQIENTALLRSPNGGEHRSAPVVVNVAGDGPMLLPPTGLTATRWGVLVVVAVVLVVVFVELRGKRHALGDD
jgi:uncharacterized repeat protein (TIGR01451 family)